jgi:hypothetical protein
MTYDRLLHGSESHDAATVGTTSDASYVHDQGVPATTWTVVHNLGKYPAVSVVDSADTVVYGGLVYLDLNTVELTFAFAFGGRAFCN